MSEKSSTFALEIGKEHTWLCEAELATVGTDKGGIA